MKTLFRQDEEALVMEDSKEGETIEVGDAMATEEEEEEEQVVDLISKMATRDRVPMIADGKSQAAAVVVAIPNGEVGMKRVTMTTTGVVVDVAVVEELREDGDEAESDEDLFLRKAGSNSKPMQKQTAKVAETQLKLPQAIPHLLLLPRLVAVDTEDVVEAAAGAVEEATERKS
jgi:hypothetical protein